MRRISFLPLLFSFIFLFYVHSLSFGDTITTETPVYLGTSKDNVVNWGTAYAAVSLDQYKVDKKQTISNKEAKTGIWKERFNTLTNYLNKFGSNKMTTDNTNASASNGSRDNFGLLSTNSHEVEYHSAKGGLKSVDLNSIYGRRADVYKRDSGEAVSGYNQLIREGASALALAYDSTAAVDSAYEDPGFGHTWNYNANSDSWTGSTASSKTIDDHGMGIYSFVTGFIYDPASTLEYLNGWFSILGNLEDVLINGKSLLENDYYWMSEDVHSSQWFGSYDFELNLEKLFDDGWLKDGNNNIAFVVDSYPAEILLGKKFDDNNDALIGFAADVWKTDTSIIDSNLVATPEPATILIFGLGLVAIGLRRRFTKKG
ncbi:MAG: PEP-CTERM sorting domain-containing protein [Planctomycetaceae bacterium]|nr:PEP-CTERM sorting domain-containing protein [Planctomycetaceae bacterium]